MRTIAENKKHAEYMKEYRRTHPEHVDYMREYLKKYRAEHRQELTEKNRKYNDRNPRGSVGHLKKLSVGVTKAWQDPDVIKKHSDAISKSWLDPDVRCRRSEGIKRAWAKLRNDPEHMRKILARRTPSHYEKIVIELIAKFNLPYQYVGDGQLWIGGKNPDFAHYDKKILIEVYGTKQKREVVGSDNYEMDRSMHFAKFGFSVIFLNETDLFDDHAEARCLQKIDEIAPVAQRK